MNILFTNSQSDLAISSYGLRRAVKCILKFLKITTSEVSIELVSEKKICELHAEFFNDPTLTDCITFPIDPPGEAQGVLGEVFVCPSTALKYAKEHQTDPYEECALYLVHGLLHLAGYDDIEDVDRKAMRKAEADCLQVLKTHKISLRPRNSMEKKQNSK